MYEQTHRMIDILVYADRDIGKFEHGIFRSKLVDSPENLRVKKLR